MRKIITTLVCVFAYFVCSAQYVLTPEGLVSEADNSKDYVVAQYEGSTAEDNLLLLKNWIVDKYVSSKNAVSELGSTVSIRAIHRFEAKVNRFNLACELIYIIKCTAKDDRVKIDFLIEKMTCNDYTMDFIGKRYMGTALFNRDGEVIQPDYKEKVETYINEIVNEVIGVIQRTDTSDDW